MGREVSQFIGWFFLLIVVALVALNASAFKTVIDAAGSFFGNIAGAVLVTTTPPGVGRGV